MIQGWHIFLGDRTDFSTAESIEQAVSDYPPKVRRQIIAVIKESAMSSPLPIESDIAFLAVKTRTWKRTARQDDRKGRGA